MAACPPGPPPHWGAFTSADLASAVIFDCGKAPYTDRQSAKCGHGVVLKGSGHLLYANTVWGANNSELCIPKCVEKLKPFHPQYPRMPQGVNTMTFNTAGNKTDGSCGCNPDAGFGGNVTALFRGELAAMRLQDPAAFNFVPRPDSPLVDAGAIIPPYTDGFVGKAPDIGAYELGGPSWGAGCRRPGC